MSQRSSLPISHAVITPTHMELSIRRLLHTGTQPPSRESERVDIEMKPGREGEFPTASSERPLAVTISSMRRVSFNCSNCEVIPQFTECHGTSEEWSSCNLLVFELWSSSIPFPLYGSDAFNFFFGLTKGCQYYNRSMVYHKLHEKEECLDGLHRSLCHFFNPAHSPGPLFLLLMQNNILESRRAPL